jgi:hypothetical protein
VKVREQHLPGTDDGQLIRLRLFNLDDQVGAPENVGSSFHKLGAGVRVQRVGKAGADARFVLHKHSVTRAGKLFDADRQHGHSVLIALDFLGHADNHGKPPLA